MRKTIATLTALLGLAVTPTVAGAAYGDNFGIAPVNVPGFDAAPALAGSEHAYWAGACDLGSAPGFDAPIPDGIGSRPATEWAYDSPDFVPIPASVTPRHCVDRGLPGDYPSMSLWDEAPAWRQAPLTAAGAHPDGSLTMAMARNPTGEGNGGDGTPGPAGLVDGTLDNIYVELPPGFSGDPNAVAKCSQEQFAVKPLACPAESQVGVLQLNLVGVFSGAKGHEAIHPVYNLEPRKGYVAELGFGSASEFGVAQFRISAKVRSSSDFGVTTFIGQIPAALPLIRQQITLWSVPWAAENDIWRYPEGQHPGPSNPCSFQPGTSSGRYIPDGGLKPECQTPYESSWGPIKPFLINPTRCDGEEDITTLMIDSYQKPGPFNAEGEPVVGHPNWKTYGSPSPPLTGCEALDFAPTLTARPTTNVADSPTGLDVDLHIPQNDDPDGLATAHLKKTVVTLPEDLVLNPSAANGLAACSSAQIGLTTTTGAHPTPIRFNNEDPADGKGQECPAAARVAAVRVETPVLDPADYPTGEVYIAQPFDNPFNSRFAIYIVIRSPERGFIAKLAGRVTPDLRTGRLTTTFDHSPQLPFEDFTLDFKAGPHAPLRTPAACGTYSTTSALSPWSDPDGPVLSTDTYSIDRGPGGGCASSEAALPNSPGFDAGSLSPIAGTHSPFVLNLRREDGSQRFSTVKVVPPPGLVAKLVGTATCSDSALAVAASRAGREEQASPSCPPAAEIGNVFAAAGAGPSPYHVGGKVYLAGPYKGAPLSLALVTPAVAGPFDIGTVVVRTALYVDPRTAQISAVSDPIPSILEGIVLDVRSASVRIDKPQFTLNPTSCDPMSVSGALDSTQGQLAPLLSRFQLAECGRLGFKPSMTLRLTGGTKRAKYQGLTAVVTARPGDANIARASVTMPRSAFLAQEHIRTVCTRVQWAVDACPPGSIYGKVTATTPLLDYPLTGNVYLRSSDNNLPDLVPDLRGPSHQPIRIELAGRTDSVKGALRNTFDIVPDAPVTKFTLELFGGKKGLIINSQNLCTKRHRATVKLAAHNGSTYDFRPEVRNGCKKLRKAKGKKKGRRGAHRREADGRR